MVGARPTGVPVLVWGKLDDVVCCASEHECPEAAWRVVSRCGSTALASNSLYFPTYSLAQFAARRPDHTQPADAVPPMLIG